MKTFTVNDPNGNLKPGIISCFLAQLLLDTANPPATLRAKNGTIYQAIYDNFEVPPIPMNKIIPVLVSFQVHDDGNFAVIRNLSTPFN